MISHISKRRSQTRSILPWNRYQSPNKISIRQCLRILMLSNMTFLNQRKMTQLMTCSGTLMIFLTKTRLTTCTLANTMNTSIRMLSQPKVIKTLDLVLINKINTISINKRNLKSTKVHLLGTITRT